MNDKKEMIAVSGLDCGSCEIRLAPKNPKIVQELTDYFKSD
ncbi:MAG: hypothetical protein ACTSWY_02725 [Promethearchaeota archaeon]